MTLSPILKVAHSRDAVAIARMSATLIEHGLPHAWSAARVAFHIQNKESVVLVAKSEDQVRGFAIMEFGECSAHLNLLAVSPMMRRCGIARRMLRWLHESAITAGIFEVHLELRATNCTAFKFYLSMGYEQTGVRFRYYSGREDAISMRRNLAVTIDAPPAKLPHYLLGHPPGNLPGNARGPR